MWHCLPLIIGLASGGGTPSGPNGAAALLERAVARAETHLREGEVQIAESEYRSVLLQAWFLVGTLQRIDGELPEARDAFRRASASAVDNRQALQALAVVHLQMGEAGEAVRLLEPLATKDPEDPLTRRLLARALMAHGQPERGVEELEKAHATAPEDLEVAFDLASGYLKLGQVDDAEPLFAQVIQARPIPQTHILVGRMYQAFDEPERAEAEYRAALKQDPRVRRAHYQLGLLLLRDGVRERFEDAAAEFEAEVRIAPEDPLANLELGSLLVEIRRPEDALAPLELVARSTPPQARTFYYLGRSQLALDRVPEAVASLKRALSLAEEQGANAEALRLIQNQLARALLSAGERDEAAAHFEKSRRLSAEGAAAERERLERYLAGDRDREEEAETSPVPVIEASPLADLAPPERLDLMSEAKETLARTYFNLGVMQTQQQRFARAAEMFESAAGVDPDFPRVEASLGVARFNAGQFDRATAPLTRAVESHPSDPGLRRLLAMAWLNTQEYEKAAELLRDDPERLKDPSLQFAFGLALVKSDRPAEAERVFSSLVALHGDSAELSVLLGQAHAQQGDFTSAIESFRRALNTKPDIPEANAALGVIYLKQGRLKEAEEALRAELSLRPGDVQSQQNLAVVLDATQRSDEALRMVREVLKAEPEFADARYLMGKILLGRGDVVEAVAQLEAAARLAPEDSNIRYQLARAYQKAGRAERARQEFEVFRQLKATKR
jgi:tetratricopeptide (TPR) repeat protein